MENKKKRLIWVVDNFLQNKDISGAVRNDRKAEETVKGLKRNLYGEDVANKLDDTLCLKYSEISPEIMSRKTLFGEHVELTEETDTDQAIIKLHGVGTATERRKYNILEVYADLKDEWNKLTKKLKGRNSLLVTASFTSQIPIKMNFIQDNIQFLWENHIYCFYRLIDGIEFDFFRSCEYCDRIFLASRKNKIYCSKQCGNNFRQKKLRNKDPDAYRAKQRDIMKKQYRKKVLG